MDALVISHFTHYHFKFSDLDELIKKIIVLYSYLQVQTPLSYEELSHFHDQLDDRTMVN